MRINQKALESYGAVKVVTGVSDANSVQLIQMRRQDQTCLAKIRNCVNNKPQ